MNYRAKTRTLTEAYFVPARQLILACSALVDGSVAVTPVGPEFA
jgi:hypothetical protein